MSTRSIAFIVKDQSPEILGPDDTVRRACQRMWERRIGAVLVVDGKGVLAGIFTGRDAVRMLAEDSTGADTPLSRAMTPHPATIEPQRTAIDALRAMSDGGYRHLPVVDGGKVVGIVSRGDFNGVEFERLSDETSLWECIS
jgi:CBS domain-containing protein